MTKEGKINMWFDTYEGAMNDLRKEYEIRFAELPVNSYGETSAAAVLDLNMWKVEQENRIRREMIAQAAEMFG